MAVIENQIKARARTLHLFLGFLIFSIVGSACADFALIWYCVKQLAPASVDIDTLKKTTGSGLLTSYYIGQAIGIVLLAPFLSYFIDKIPRRTGGIAIDLSYISVLIALIWANKLDLLAIELLLPISMLTAALGSLHRGAIGYAALKTMSEELGVTTIVAKFHASLFFANLIGASISGILFSWVGLIGALVLAIVTFLPMPFIYLLIFQSDQRPKNSSAPLRLADFISGWEVIFKDRLLLWATASVTIVNLASNIFPGLVAISYQKAFPDKTLYASTAVSLSILVGVISYGPASRLARQLELRWIPGTALFAPIISLLITALIPNPFTLTVAFALQCAGAALLNTMTGSIRVLQIPQHKIAQVNSSFHAILYSGQIMGSLVLIPVMQQSESLGSLSIFAAFILASLVGYRFLPSKSLAKVENK